jgi:hypothetical protein
MACAITALKQMERFELAHCAVTKILKKMTLLQRQYQQSPPLHL